MNIKAKILEYWFVLTIPFHQQKQRRKRGWNVSREVSLQRELHSTRNILLEAVIASSIIKSSVRFCNEFTGAALLSSALLVSTVTFLASAA
jgi:hypothetical protein